MPHTSQQEISLTVARPRWNRQASRSWHPLLQPTTWVGPQLTQLAAAGLWERARGRKWRENQHPPRAHSPHGSTFPLNRGEAVRFSQRAAGSRSLQVAISLAQEAGGPAGCCLLGWLPGDVISGQASPAAGARCDGSRYHGAPLDHGEHSFPDRDSCLDTWT